MLGYLGLLWYIDEAMEATCGIEITWNKGLFWLLELESIFEFYQ